MQTYILILVHFWHDLLKLLNCPIVDSDGTCSTVIPNDVHNVLRNNTLGRSLLNFDRLFRGAKRRMK